MTEVDFGTNLNQDSSLTTFSSFNDPPESSNDNLIVEQLQNSQSNNGSSNRFKIQLLLETGQRYEVTVDRQIHSTTQAFINYLCQQFGYRDPHMCFLVKPEDPKTMIQDMINVHPSDKLILKKQQLNTAPRRGRPPYSAYLQGGINQYQQSTIAHTMQQQALQRQKEMEQLAKMEQPKLPQSARGVTQRYLPNPNLPQKTEVFKMETKGETQQQTITTCDSPLQPVDRYQLEKQLHDMSREEACEEYNELKRQREEKRRCREDIRKTPQVQNRISSTPMFEDIPLPGFKPQIPGIPAPTILKDRLFFEDYKNVDKFIETPDFLEFANFGLVSNRDDLINKMRKMALNRGFRMIVPWRTEVKIERGQKVWMPIRLSVPKSYP